MSDLDKLVEEVLSSAPQTRASDALLVLEVWRRLGLELTPDQVQMALSLPSSETITRCSRKFQSSGWYKADPETRAHRKIKQMRYRQSFRQEKLI